MAKVLECTACGKVFTKKETVEKHAKRIHGTNEVIKQKGKLFDL